MKRFRAVTAIIVIISLCFSLYGCSFRFSSFDSLLRPPRAVGKYRELQVAFEKVVSKDYILCSPENGEYKSAFLTFDCDSDGDEDAIVFYALKSEPDLARLCYFKYSDEKWVHVSSIDGAGSTVNTVLFSDINLDGNYEIIVGWNLLSGKTNKAFVTYLLSGEKIQSLTPYPYNYICLLDANGDGREDIFTMSVDSSSAELMTGFARVYNFNANTSTLDVLSEARTDGNVSGYNSVSTETVDGVNYIYVEASKGEAGSITELLYWDSRKGENKLVSPLFDTASQTTKSTWRNINISCIDIDGDGFLEIPVSVIGNNVYDNSSVIEQKDDTYEIMDFIKWVRFRNNRLIDVQYSIVNDKLGYVCKIPSSWVERIIVKNSSGNIEAYRRLSGSGKTGDLLFSICHYDSAEGKNNYSTYKALGMNGDTSFVYRITDEGKKFGVKDKTFEKDFILKDFG